MGDYDQLIIENDKLVERWSLVHYPLANFYLLTLSMGTCEASHDIHYREFFAVHPTYRQAVLNGLCLNLRELCGEIRELCGE